MRFVEENFEQAGSDIIPQEPSDFVPDPPFLASIEDEAKRSVTGVRGPLCVLRFNSSAFFCFLSRRWSEQASWCQTFHFAACGVQSIEGGVGVS